MYAKHARKVTKLKRGDGMTTPKEKRELKQEQEREEERERQNEREYERKYERKHSGQEVTAC